LGRGGRRHTPRATRRGSRCTSLYSTVWAVYITEGPDDAGDVGMDDPADFAREVDAAVASALRDLRAPVRGFPLLWEHGYLGVVLGGRQLQQNLPVVLQDRHLVPQLGLESARPVDRRPAQPERDDGHVRVVGDAATRVARKRKIDDVKIQDYVDQKMDEALRSWRGLLGDMGDASLLYRQITQSDSDFLANRTFAAVFFGKPSSTLMQRACSLRLFVRWARASGHKPFPLVEDIVFKYLDDLNLEGAPATRGQAFKEALNFAKGYAGLEGVSDVLASRRVIGSALASYSRKREPNKRLPLTKVEMQCLERFVVDSAGPMRDRVLAGFALMCAYGRLRVGDASRLDREPTLDVDSEGVGYFEAGLLEHKTSSRVRSRVRLPAAGSAIGIDGLEWARAWLALRKSANLDASVQGFLMPAPGLDGSWDSRKLTTADCSVWFRELLSRLIDIEPSRLSGIGSHSLKGTLLSWAAKFGLSAGPRRKLGGHVKPADRSLVEYSRDEMSGPLREMDRVLDAIRRGTFEPDNTRSGRFVKDDSAPQALDSLLPSAATSVRSAAQSVSESSTSSSDSSSASEVVDTDDAASNDDDKTIAVSEDMSPGVSFTDVPPELPEFGVTRNLSNGVMHGNRDSKLLLCGRPLPKNHLALDAWPKRPWPLCRDCFRSSASSSAK